jgi:PAS domain S-box-containing protein
VSTILLLPTIPNLSAFITCASFLAVHVNGSMLSVIVVGVLVVFHLLFAKLRQSGKQRELAAQLLRLQSAALQAAATGILITDRQGKVVWVNRAQCNLTGYEEHEILGCSPRLFRSGVHDDNFYRDLWKTALSGNVWRGEIVNRKKNGELYIEDMVITPVPDENNVASHFIAIKTEATERKAQEDILQRSEATLRSFVSNAPFGICHLNLKGNIWDINPALRRMLGYGANEDFGPAHISELGLNSDAMSLFLSRLAQSPSTLETTWKKKDGSTVRLNFAFTFNHDRSGKSFQAYIEDVSDLRREEYEVNRLKRALTTLSKGNQALIHAVDEIGLLNEICQIAVELGGYRMAWIGYAQNDQAKSICPVATFGLEEGYLDKVRLTWAEVDAPMACGEAIRTGKAVVVQDIPRNFARPLLRKESMARGYGSVVALPIQIEGRTIGALAIYATELDGFDEAELLLLRELVEDLAFGINSLRQDLHRQRAEAALQESEGRYKLLFDRNLSGVFHANLDRKVIKHNDAFRKILGYDEGTDLVGLCCTDFLSAADCESIHEKLAEVGDLVNQEITFKCKDGSTIPVLLNICLVHDLAGVPVGFIGSFLDLTEMRHLQDKLVRSQKLEAVGQLTGGIAHDFNNILMIISSYGELALDELDEDHPARQRIGQIRTASNRGAALTKQLLAFSRKQVLIPTALNLGGVASGMCEMLQTMIGEDIVLSVTSSPDLWIVQADHSQVEQILLNLSANARDAMPKGGSLRIEVSNVTLDDDFVFSNPGSAVGDYVMMVVSDNGSGMPPEVQGKVFEPFFTTKAPGKGTGLGLSTVYGIVKQSNGYVTLESSVGVGTNFRIYLPRCVGASASLHEIHYDRSDTLLASILLVEDEEPTRVAIAEYLTRNQFKVTVAKNALEALQLFTIGGGGAFDILLTDVVMPGMSGKDLADSVRTLCPELKVIFMSGYTDEKLAPHGISDFHGAFLSKPFGLDDLRNTIRNLPD